MAHVLSDVIKGLFAEIAEVGDGCKIESRVEDHQRESPDSSTCFKWLGWEQRAAKWSWSHAAWLLNRYQPNHGRTSYELLIGHGYNGKIALSGEPVLAFTYVPGRPKGSAKWTRGVPLGRSILNDTRLIATPERIFLTRAIRRNMSDWADATDLYMKFDIHPWRKSRNDGGKVHPRPEGSSDWSWSSACSVRFLWFRSSSFTIGFRNVEVHIHQMKQRQTLRVVMTWLRRTRSTRGQMRTKIMDKIGRCSRRVSEKFRSRRTDWQTSQIYRCQRI